MWRPAGILMVIATPVLADCPVAADLATGIRFTQEDGSTEVFRKIDAQTLEVTGLYEGDFAALFKLAKGAYLIDYVDIYEGQADAETRVTYSFPVAYSDLPTPEAGTKWTTPSVVRDSYGLYKETLDVSWGTAQAMQYGDCSYTMFPGTFSYAGEDYLQEEVVHYLVELSVAYLASYDDDQLDQADVFTVVDIAKVAE